MIWRMATPFDTDYSFLNLPEMGSDVRGPIDLPSVEPIDSTFRIGGYAPERLPETELVQPSLDPFSEEENQELLSSARPFEDIQSLGATFGQRLAETEKFFGDRISDLQNNISDLEGAKSNLTGELESAISEQDVIRQQSAEEQMQALDAQRAELEAQLQSAVAEAEANGVNALEAAKASAADKIGQLDAEIARTTEDLQNAIAEQDVIRQQADQQRLTELETQKETLTVQFQEQTASLEQKFGARESELEGQIGNLQGEINALTGARDAALAERDNAIAQQDTIRAEAADAQAQALDAQAGDYQSQLDQITGQVGERDQTIADLQAQLEGLQQAPAETPVDTPPPPPQDFGGPVIPPRPPQLPPKMKDPIFIDDGPGFIDDKQPPINVPGGTQGFYDRKGPIAKDPRIPDPREKFISYEREPLVPIFKPSPIKAPPPKMSVGGIGGFSGKRTGRMARK